MHQVSTAAEAIATCLVTQIAISDACLYGTKGGAALIVSKQWSNGCTESVLDMHVPIVLTEAVHSL